MISKVEGNFQGYGPAVEGAFITGRGMGGHEFFMVFQGPSRDEPATRSLPPGAGVGCRYQFYSVFQVKRDPGVWWVYAGFLLFLPGFYLAFFRPHQRWAVVLEESPKGGWKGRLLGASPRAREDFEVRQSPTSGGI